MQMYLITLGKLTGIILFSARSVVAAYIDPNTGGMLFQILAVLFGVISGALLLFSGRIKGLYYKVRRRFQGSEVDETVEDDIHHNDVD